MRRIRLLAMLTVVAALGLGSLLPVRAQQAPSLAVVPPSQTVALGEDSFDVSVTVDDVTNLGGYTLVMTYDPDVLRALTITDSGLAGSTGNAVLCPASAIDNDAGRLAHFCFTIPLFAGPGPQTSEPQVLVMVRFEPVAEGTTTLDISDSSIIDPQGNGLGASTANGTVTLSSGIGPRPEV
ncbi:MAG: hypothetical protein HY723_04865, partial [Chloroflexi bacterium]|nr:hypothetical protein [Chloroflexota bacterium]